MSILLKFFEAWPRFAISISICYGFLLITLLAFLITFRQEMNHANYVIVIISLKPVSICSLCCCRLGTDVRKSLARFSDQYRLRFSAHDSVGHPTYSQTDEMNPACDDDGLSTLSLFFIIIY